MHVYSCFVTLTCYLRRQIPMDYPMSAKIAVKSQSFRNCRIQIVKGDYSLSTQDGGDCVVDVFGDPGSGSLDIRVRSGKLTDTFWCILKQLNN